MQGGFQGQYQKPIEKIDNIELHRPYIDEVHIKCPHCGDEIRLYGDGSSIERSAAEIGSRVTDKVPLDPEVTNLVDSGNAEKVSEDLLSGTAGMVIELIKK